MLQLKLLSGEHKRWMLRRAGYLLLDVCCKDASNKTDLMLCDIFFFFFFVAEGQAGWQVKAKRDKQEACMA